MKAIINTAITNLIGVMKLVQEKAVSVTSYRYLD